MSDFLKWIVRTLLKDIIGFMLPTVIVIGVMIIVVVNFSEYSGMLFFPIVVIAIYLTGKLIK
ncbi:hypothetical protein DOJ73_19125 [Salmonella enterica subsp. enterica]|nr:hypothetical protein [Salmonella enterica subsp. enterica]